MPNAETDRPTNTIPPKPKSAWKSRPPINTKILHTVEGARLALDNHVPFKSRNWWRARRTLAKASVQP